MLKALAPPPGTSDIGTPRLPGLGGIVFGIVRVSLSSYGCGPLRSWTPSVVVVVDLRNVGKSIHRAALRKLPGRFPRSADALCVSRSFENSHHSHFRAFLVISKTLLWCNPSRRSRHRSCYTTLPIRNPMSPFYFYRVALCSTFLPKFRRHALTRGVGSKARGLSRVDAVDTRSTGSPIKTRALISS